MCVYIYIYAHAHTNKCVYIYIYTHIFIYVINLSSSLSFFWAQVEPVNGSWYRRVSVKTFDIDALSARQWEQ